MANTKKEDRVSHNFAVIHYRTLREDGLNYNRIFDICWKRIPEALTKKLNCIELIEYINLHILPKVVSEQKALQSAPSARPYSRESARKSTLEVFA
ncbi:MAG: hypothetical protein HS129_15190 [Leptospiraceae bacterium]|nr:hypothetical protein [Leptospiraceae bacterium]NUM41349.1 hypothetical protein [Leptospiraceae bacterium]